MPRPLKFRLCYTKSTKESVRRLIVSAEKHKAKHRGNIFAEKLLRYLVSAKLSLIIPQEALPQMHGAYVADAISDRGGDFSCGDAVIHVTSAPGEALIRKCAGNIDDGYHPIIITTSKRVSVAEALAESEGIANRIEVWDIEQFLSMNLNERGLFCQSGRKDMASRLVEAYNKIIDECETDPSLKIEMGIKHSQ